MPADEPSQTSNVDPEALVEETNWVNLGIFVAVGVLTIVLGAVLVS